MAYGYLCWNVIDTWRIAGPNAKTWRINGTAIVGEKIEHVFKGMVDLPGRGEGKEETLESFAPGFKCRAATPRVSSIVGDGLSGQLPLPPHSLPGDPAEREQPDPVFPCPGAEDRPEHSNPTLHVRHVHHPPFFPAVKAGFFPLLKEVRGKGPGTGTRSPMRLCLLKKEGGLQSGEPLLQRILFYSDLPLRHRNPASARNGLRGRSACACAVAQAL